jgi:hypothetical protein
MPAHDWTRVSDGTFHDFHYSWVLEIKRALKRGLLPKGYYVMAEQLGGDLGAPDVLTLQATGTNPEPEGPLTGTATLTEAPPVVHARTTIARDAYARMQRTLVIRHTSGDRIVAMIEVHSPGNKSSRHALRSFLDKSVEYVLGSERPLTVAAYTGGSIVGVFVAHFVVGEPIPEMPLFLTRENYVRVPLETTYMAAWEDVPPQYQAVLLAPP